MKIIDISYHNGNIDFNKVKASGIDGVIVRAGYGKNNIDKKFKSYIKAAKDVGLLVGVYWFSYAYNVEMAKKEAEYCLRAISGYNLELPIFFDWEYDSMSYASRNGVNASKELITNMNIAFCQVVKNSGRKAGYYGSLDYFKRYIDTDKLKGFTKWLARYASEPGVSCDLWQYTEKGKVNGINGNVDTNKVINESILNNKGANTSKPVASAPVKKVSDTKMPLVKNGSRGKAVKIWQVIIGVNADGIFGKDTERVTKEFQRKHGLDADGIVGSKSWKAGLESV